MTEGAKLDVFKSH